MITRETHRLVIGEDAAGIDAFWIKRHLVKPTDVDCTDMSSEEFGDLYPARLDARKSECPNGEQS